MVSKEEVLDKVRHRDSFKLIIKAKNREPESFPGASVEEDEDRVERIISEINKSGADVHIWERQKPSGLHIA